MKNAILMAVQEKGALLFMTDGTAWKINPENVEVTSNWEPPCLVNIDEKSSSRNYDYTLTNLDTNVSVTALRHK